MGVQAVWWLGQSNGTGLNCTTTLMLSVAQGPVRNTVIIIMLYKILLCCVLLPLTMAGPTLYKLDEEKNTAERIMIPVSSTGGCLVG